MFWWFQVVLWGFLVLSWWSRGLPVVSWGSAGGVLVPWWSWHGRHGRRVAVSLFGGSTLA